MSAPKRDFGGANQAPGSAGETFGVHSVSQNLEKSRKIPPRKSWKNYHQQARNFTPKWCQNEAEIYAKTHQKSMQKQVANNIRKIMKIMFFRCVKPCQNIVLSSNNEVWQGACAGLENHQKTKKQNVKIHPKFDEKSMRKRCSNKWCWNDGKRCQNGAQRGAQIEKNVPKIHAKNDAEIWHRKGTHVDAALGKLGGPSVTF